MTEYTIYTGIIPSPLNPQALKIELAALDGFINYGLRENSNEIVGVFAGTTTASQTDFDNVLAAHDGNIVTEAQAKSIVVNNSFDQAAAIVGWASWTEEGFLSWHNDNVDIPLAAATTLEDFRAVLETISAELKALGRMEIAQRNKIWPELQE